MYKHALIGDSKGSGFMVIHSHPPQYLPWPIPMFHLFKSPLICLMEKLPSMVIIGSNGDPRKMKIGLSRWHNQETRSIQSHL